MNKRFNIRAAFEEAKEAQTAVQLEVDKEAAMTPEEKAIRDSALQLAAPTDESEGAKADAAAKVDAVDNVAPIDGEVKPVDASVIDPVATPTPTEAPVEEVKTDTIDAAATDDVVDLDPESEEGKEKAKQDAVNKEMEEDATKVEATLESICGVVKRSLNKGGMSTMAAGAVALVLKQQYARVGIAYEPKSFPAMESYDSISSRKRNTEIALESIGTAIARVRLSIEKSVSKRTKKAVAPVVDSSKTAA